MSNAFLLKPLPAVAISMFGSVPGFDFTGGALPAGASLTRASANATRTNSSGVQITAAADTARFDYDPISGALLGLLIEPSRTNLAAYSDDQTNWGAQFATAVADVANGATGSAAADRLAETSANQTQGRYKLYVGANGARLVVSAYGKADTRNYLTLSVGDGAPTADWFGASFNVATGAVAQAAAGGSAGTAIYATGIAAAPQGLYRAYADGTRSGGASNSYVYVGSADTSSRVLSDYGLAKFAGTTGLGPDIWGVQLEAVATGERAGPSTYIATTSATATRAADVVTLNWALLGVSNGAATVRYTFDDGSTQDVPTTIAGGTSTVPTNLNRAWIRRAELSSGVGSTPDVGAATNLLNDYAGVIAEASCGIGGSYQAKIRLDLGADTSIDTIVVFGVELFPTAGTLIVNYATAAQGNFTGTYTTDVTGVPYAGSAAMTNGKGVSYWALATPVTARYVEIVYQAGSAGKSVRASRVVVGKRIKLERNFSFGAAPGVKDLGALDFSARGVMQRRRGAKLRTIGLTFSHIRKDEVEAFTKPLLEQIGNTELVALVLDPAADAQRQNRSYFGPLVGDLSQVWRNAAAFEAKINMVSIF